jgi:hypothetical protein
LADSLRSRVDICLIVLVAVFLWNVMY